LRPLAQSKQIVDFRTPEMADAICINQEDLAERSSQVAIMSKIYAKTSVVNAWLGHEDNNSTTAFQIIDETLLPIITQQHLVSI
jgi:Heterokaryon incompatibility protein (HET)